MLPFAIVIMEKIPNQPIFIAPDIEREGGEIERVSQEVFGGQDTKNFLLRFLDAAKIAPLMELSEEMWSRLENTDSYDIAPGDWTLVEEHAVQGHPEHPRDWQLFKTLYEQGFPIQAPIILKTGEILHLVSGNTRLMVARALGIIPKVLLVELPRTADGA